MTNGIKKNLLAKLLTQSVQIKIKPESTIKIKMSRKRQFRSNSNPSISQFNLLGQTNRSRRWSKTQKTYDRVPLSRSIYTSESPRKRNPENDDLTHFKRDLITSKNYSSFRGIFNPNDTTQVPFMSTLREKWQFKSCQVKDGQQGQTTQFQLFNASLKTTSNMKLKKCIRDIHADPTRLSRSYYRWHNKSGQGNKQATEFQCTLRTYCNSERVAQQQESFNNSIKPIKYIDIEPKSYDTEDLVCQRQRKVFRLRQTGKLKC